MLIGGGVMRLLVEVLVLDSEMIDVMMMMMMMMMMMWTILHCNYLKQTAKLTCTLISERKGQMQLPMTE